MIRKHQIFALCTLITLFCLSHSSYAISTKKCDPSLKKDVKQKLKKLGFKLKEKDFFKALYSNRADVIELFLSVCTSPDKPEKKSGKTPLIIAIERGDMSTLKILFEYGAHPDVPGRNGKTPLEIAVKKGDPDIVAFLLENGADPDACKTNILTEAITKGQTKIVELLLQHNANPNIRIGAFQRSYLHMAILNEHTELVSLLLKTQIDVNIQDKKGRTPLHEAANMGFLKIIKDLISAGAKVNVQDRYGMTPLMDAVKNGYVKTARILLKHGANPSLQDKKGNTALHYAILAPGRNLELVKTLVEYGSPLSVRNEKGESPILLATRRGLLDVIEYLRSREAKY